jgi:hypothetical protein
MKSKGEDKAKKKIQRTLNLSDILEGYSKVMKKYGIDTQNENHYYSMMVKLSINQSGKTWRECLNYEKTVKKLINSSILIIEKPNADCSSEVLQNI